MKELSIEEKAQRYDKTIEKAKSLLGCNQLGDAWIYKLLPELKESEDERIRKDMIDTIKKESKDFPSSVIAEKSHTWLAWLEKQGEQKPAEWKQENVEELSEFENAMMHIGYSFFGKRGGLDPNDTSSVKVQAQYLLELAQKPAWSEEDEKVIHCLEYTVKHYYKDEDTIKWCGDWLKSVKDRVQPQNTWKPSEEQIKVCKEVYADILSAKGFDLGTINSELNRLEEELKKLKE